MTTKTKTKPARSLRYADGLLTITEGRSVECYKVEPVRDEDGVTLLGYRLHKRSTGEAHDVDVVADTCDCIGHCRYGYCRHLAAVNKLKELGRLEG